MRAFVTEHNEVEQLQFEIPSGGTMLIPIDDYWLQVLADAVDAEVAKIAKDKELIKQGKE